jgi:hypothetical protein
MREFVRRLLMASRRTVASLAAPEQEESAVPRGLAAAVAIAVLAFAVSLPGTAAAQPRVDTDVVPGSYLPRKYAP